MIRYFREGLRSSIWAQLDARGRDLDSWEKVVKKIVNVEAKTMLQSSSSTRDMDSRCLRGNTKKDEKDSGGKNKSINSTSVDTSSRKQSFSPQQTSSANPKKDPDQQQSSRCCGERRRNSFATGINASTVKKEVKNLFQVECYNCHWKRHYSNNCPRNPKAESKN